MVLLNTAHLQLILMVLGKYGIVACYQKIVEKAVRDHAIDMIITFDNYGVSGHCDHRDVHHGVYYISSSMFEHNPASKLSGFTTPSSPFGNPSQESQPAIILLTSTSEELGVAMTKKNMWQRLWCLIYQAWIIMALSSRVERFANMVVAIMETHQFKDKPEIKQCYMDLHPLGTLLKKPCNFVANKLHMLLNSWQHVPTTTYHCEEGSVTQHDMLRAITILFSSKEPTELREWLIINQGEPDPPQIPETVNAPFIVNFHRFV
ncbi:probable N-acetylglucosaminyl-phosphatidylinositol de-N-acetylase isoform X1 [Tanacetum coccineum]